MTLTSAPASNSSWEAENITIIEAQDLRRANKSKKTVSLSLDNEGEKDSYLTHYLMKMLEQQMTRSPFLRTVMAECFIKNVKGWRVHQFCPSVEETFSQEGVNDNAKSFQGSNLLLGSGQWQNDRPSGIFPEEGNNYDVTRSEVVSESQKKNSPTTYDILAQEYLQNISDYTGLRFLKRTIELLIDGENIDGLDESQSSILRREVKHEISNAMRYQQENYPPLEEQVQEEISMPDYGMRRLLTDASEEEKDQVRDDKDSNKNHKIRRRAIDSLLFRHSKSPTNPKDKQSEAPQDLYLLVVS